MLKAKHLDRALWMEALLQRASERVHLAPATPGFRNCEFCGCHTNARMRACCDAGRAADLPAPPTPTQEPTP